MDSELLKKLKELYAEDVENPMIQKMDETDIYPVSKREAVMIAGQSKNLKSDFCRQDDRNIGYIGFNSQDIELKEYNNEKYWHIKVKDADISWYDTDSDEYCDGFAQEDDLKKLQCLVNVQTGKYIYLYN